MTKSICGLECDTCELKETCNGCSVTKGKPFGKDCIIADCCLGKNLDVCENCNDKCGLIKKLSDEFNELNIPDMGKITSLNALKGSFVNVEYKLENGTAVKLLDDDKIYLGNQICKKEGDRCYGIVADEKYLLVCEYGIDGVNPEIIVYKKRG